MTGNNDLGIGTKAKITIEPPFRSGLVIGNEQIACARIDGEGPPRSSVALHRQGVVGRSGDTGNFFDFEYRFTRQGRTVASVSKRFFSFRDTYGIDIVDGEDDITILAKAVVIDLVCHQRD